jgi:hypothetical protein
MSFKQQLNQNRLAKTSTLLAAERIQKFYMPISCQYLPLSIYCNLYKYGLRITTIQGIFKLFFEGYCNFAVDLLGKDY